MKTPYSEIAFHSLSFGDPNGRLFWWNGELYRAITAERASLFRDLFNKGIAHELIKEKLIVETELTSLEINGYEMVLKHKLIPFVSYPYEWCAAMLKDAALLIIDLELELARRGLTLQDAHPWNVLFDGPKPVYVDFGSLVPAEAETLWPAYEEFCRFFLYPLLLMTQGYGRIARWLLHDYDQGVLYFELAALTHHSQRSFRLKSALSIAKRLIPSQFRPALKKGLAVLRSKLPRYRDTLKYRLTFLKQLRLKVERVAIPELKTEWSDYYDNCFPPFSPSCEWTAKHFSIFQVLSELKPRSVLDIGSNKGWYSQLVARCGSQVVAFDIDEASVTKLYFDAKENNLYILPLVMDFRNPSPGYGLCNQWLAPAIERLRCDMVLALALVHHLSI